MPKKKQKESLTAEEPTERNEKVTSGKTSQHLEDKDKERAMKDAGETAEEQPTKKQKTGLGVASESQEDKTATEQPKNPETKDETAKLSENIPKSEETPNRPTETREGGPDKMKGETPNPTPADKTISSDVGDQKPIGTATPEEATGHNLETEKKEGSQKEAATGADLGTSLSTPTSEKLDTK